MVKFLSTFCTYTFPDKDAPAFSEDDMWGGSILKCACSSGIPNPGLTNALSLDAFGCRYRRESMQGAGISHFPCSMIRKILSVPNHLVLNVVWTTTVRRDTASRHNS